MAKLAREEIAPYVREMEDNNKFKDSVVDLLFQNGVSVYFRWARNKFSLDGYKYTVVALKKTCK